MTRRLYARHHLPPIRRPARRLLPRLCGLLLLLPALAEASGASVTMTARPRKLVMGDMLTVKVSIRGEFDDLRPPASDGFVFRQVGRSSQVSIVGSSITRSVVLTYRGAPKRPGKWRVSPAQALKRGVVVAGAAPAVVEVTDARAALGEAVNPTAASDLKQFTDEPFFVRPVLSSSSPVVGQPFVVRYELYWAAGASVQGIQEASQANFANLNTEDLLKGDPSPQERVRVNGAVYFRQVTRKVLLTPAKAGAYELIGPGYRVEVGDFFDTRRFKVTPPVVQVMVYAPPEEGRPKDFKGETVGRFRISAKLSHRGRPSDKLSLKTGERAVVTFEVSGVGNLLDLPAIEPPTVPNLNFEPLPGKDDQQVDFGEQGPRGKRRWQYLVTASAAGTHVIPAVKLPAFDPDAKRYYTVSSAPLTLEVAGKPIAKASATEGAVQANKRNAPPPLALRPIAADSGLQLRASAPWSDGGWFWPAAALPWLGLLLMLWVARARRRWRAGHGQRQKLNALATATAALTEAQDIAALHQATLRYLEQRLGLEAAGLTSAALKRALELEGLNPQVIQDVSDALSACEHARFIPGGGSEQLEALRGDLASALAATERHVTGAAPGAAAIAVLLLAATLWAPAPAAASSLDDTFHKANQLQLSGRHQEAIDSYESLLKHGLDNAAIHYNLGTCYARTDELGKALGHYRRAERLHPEAALAADLKHNAKQVRLRLANRARRNHRVLHIFDETPELEIAVAQAAPRDLLGGLILLLGALMLAVGWLLLAGRGKAAWLIALCVAQTICGAWLLHSQRVERQLRPGVVVSEDVPLTPCTGVADPLQLPEGLELRIMRQRPDGRLEVRLRNGRRGCLRPEAIYEG